MTFSIEHAFDEDSAIVFLEDIKVDTKTGKLRFQCHLTTMFLISQFGLDPTTGKSNMNVTCQDSTYKVCEQSHNTVKTIYRMCTRHFLRFDIMMYAIGFP